MSLVGWKGALGSIFRKRGSLTGRPEPRQPITIETRARYIESGRDEEWERIGQALAETPRAQSGIKPRTTRSCGHARQRTRDAQTDLKRHCTAAGLKSKYPQFVLWNHILDVDLKDLIDGANFVPKAYAESLTLRKYGITSRETLKKDRAKVRTADRKQQSF
jgi:hypothetical protein